MRHVGIVKMGCKHASNSLHDEYGGYSNVDVAHELTDPDVKHLRALENLISEKGWWFRSI